MSWTQEIQGILPVRLNVGLYWPSCWVCNQGSSQHLFRKDRCCHYSPSSACSFIVERNYWLLGIEFIKASNKWREEVKVSRMFWIRGLKTRERKKETEWGGKAHGSGEGEKQWDEVFSYIQSWSHVGFYNCIKSNTLVSLQTGGCYKKKSWGTACNS